ncbi:MAG: EI24 domain-containing protein [Phycisphaerae bacterium]
MVNGSDHMPIRGAGTPRSNSPAPDASPVSGSGRDGPRGNDPMKEFSTGFKACFRAAKMLLTHPSLLLLSMIPVIITLIVVGLLIWGGMGAWGTWGDPWLAQHTGHWWSWAWWIAWVLALVALILIGLFGFTIVGALVMIPFMDPISERSEKIYRRSRPDLPEYGGSAAGEGLLHGSMRGATDAVRLTTWRLLVTLPMLLFLLIPVVGKLVFLLFSAYLNGMDFTDMVLSRKGHTWSEKKVWMKQHRPLVMGLGVGLALILLVPMTTLLALPVGAVAATLAIVEQTAAAPLQEGPA